ncbi:MAG: DUF1688 family protein [Alphaproteobacteria bacterium]
MADQQTRTIPAPAWAADWLRTADAVRQRCHQVLAAAERDQLAHFQYRPERMEFAAALVLDEIRRNYIDLDVPYHSRWRHFAIDGRDQWARLEEALDNDIRVQARRRFDLAVVSVLLDAGAGDVWQYKYQDRVFARSEGLAIASMQMFIDGSFSSDARQLRADLFGLEKVTPEKLAEGMQVGDDNPMPGLAGRAHLLRRLGDALRRSPAHFGTDPPRVGNLFDYFAAQDQGAGVSAAHILATLLEVFGPIWPGRMAIGSVSLGDVWEHPAAGGGDPWTAGLVPFHKLSQWMAYSLVEPLEAAGVKVTGLDRLTGLAEYRNGGLFVDLGVLELRDPAIAEWEHEPGDMVVVEWRALTVALLDKLAIIVRDRLDLDEQRFPLTKLLQGGTWSAGRALAARRRHGGPPPIRIVSDGTVF